MQQDYSLHSGGATFEGVCCTSFGLGSAPMPIKGMPAGKWGRRGPTERGIVLGMDLEAAGRPAAAAVE
jgi:hypothetical protein